MTENLSFKKHKCCRTCKRDTRNYEEVCEICNFCYCNDCPSLLAKKKCCGINSCHRCDDELSCVICDAIGCEACIDLASAKSGDWLCDKCATECKTCKGWFEPFYVVDNRCKTCIRQAEKMKRVREAIDEEDAFLRQHGRKPVKRLFRDEN